MDAVLVRHRWLCDAESGLPVGADDLGVVLGRIAELWLSRATAITTEITPFFTHPWSLFFMILSALFAMFFSGIPGAARTQGLDAIFSTPGLLAALALPMFMMVGTVRPMLGGVLLVIAADHGVPGLTSRGWKVDPSGCGRPSFNRRRIRR